MFLLIGQYYIFNNKVQMKNKERIRLVENFDKKIILEVDGGSSALERYKKDPNIPIYLTGIIQKGDAPNRNGRIYPFSLLKKECDRYLNEEVKDGQSFGELDHSAEGTVPELKNASHTIEDIWYKGTEVWGRIKLLNAFMPGDSAGGKARGIVLNEKVLGISSRALGSVYQEERGYDIVEDDLEIICWDLVSRPSTHQANLKLHENKSKHRKAGQLLLTESQCFGEQCYCKPTKQLIKEHKLNGLSIEEKVYLNILGVEKFLQIKNKI